jgi:uncharacterized protein (TIGR02145 family)
MKTKLTVLLLMLTFAVTAQQTVIIGSQQWMTENLNVGTMILSGQNMANTGTIEKYCPGNYEPNCNIYGGLYQWDEAMNYSTVEGSQGLCPDGFHIPTKSEWDVLYNYLGGIMVAGGKIKEAGTVHWKGMYPTRPTNRDATNSSGFTALPGGMKGAAGGMYYIGVDANMWSSTQGWQGLPTQGRAAYSGGAMYSVKSATENQFYKKVAISVRCLKDGVK